MKIAVSEIQGGYNMQIQKQNSLQFFTTNSITALTVNKTSVGTAQTLLGTSPITTAFNVTISDKGKEAQTKSEQLRHDVVQEDSPGEATDELNALDAKEQERKSKLQVKDALQKQLDEDDGKLTDDDKQTIQDEIDKLTNETKTPDDKINEINDKISKLTKDIDTMSPDDQMMVSNRVVAYKKDIQAIKADQKKAYDARHKLETQSRQEKADQMSNDMKATETTEATAASKEKNSADNTAVAVVSKMLTDSGSLSYIDNEINKDKDNSDTKIDTDSSQQINPDGKKVHHSQKKSEDKSSIKVTNDNVQNEENAVD